MAPDLPCFGWDCANASIGGGPGVSFRTGLFRDTFYLFSRVQADAGPGLSPWYRLGAGGEAGLLLEPLPRWRLQAEVGYLYHFLGTRTNTWGILPYTAGSNLSLTQNTELRITATWLQDEFVDAVAYFGLYF
jgi:hypothetical protein